MSNQCPYCGSIRNVCVSSVSVRHICLACEKFFSEEGEEQPKQTVFEKITSSLEVLAEKLVFCAEYKTIRPMYLEGKGGIIVAEVWKSTIIPDATFSSEPEAIAATLARLKEAADE